MTQPFFSQDLDNAIHALKSYIVAQEDHLIQANAGDVEWDKLEPYKASLRNFQYMFSIYGKV